MFPPAASTAATASVLNSGVNFRRGLGLLLRTPFQGLATDSGVRQSRATDTTTYLQAKFWRVAGPRADSHRKAKAAIAVAPKILIAAYYIMVSNGETYRDLGPDHIANRDDPERRRDRLVSQLAKLGRRRATTRNCMTS